MKINDVIKKCIKIPGISIKQAEYSMELILNTKEATVYKGYKQD